MSGQDKAPKPSRNPAGRPTDLDQQPLPGGPRHMKAVPGPGPGPQQWATHRLVSIAARLYERQLNRRLARLKLTTSALDALEAVAELEPATATDVAAMLCVSRQSLGKVLRRLQSLGYLSRERGRDGRSAYLDLTPEGRAALSAAESLISEESSGETGTDFADEAVFRQQLEQHIRHLRNTESGTVIRHRTRERQARTVSSSRHGQEHHSIYNNESGAPL